MKITRWLLVFLLAACGGAADPTTTPGTPADATTTQPPGTPAEAPTTPPTETPADATTTQPPGTPADCPHVIGVELVETASGVFRVSATVRSVDIAGVSYADAWEVRDRTGTVLGTRILTHPHPNEQPFTRSLSDVTIPPEVTHVVVAARDSVQGFCGDTFEIEVPRS